MVGDDKVASTVLDPVEYDEIITTKDSETIVTFSSRIIHASAKPAFIGIRFNVMTQALHADERLFPQCLTIQNAYMEMCSSSKSINIIVRNSMVYPQTFEEEGSGGKGSSCQLGARAMDETQDD